MIISKKLVAILMLRNSAAGSINFTSERWTGVSSNALVNAALTGVKVPRGSYPSDFSDLKACVITQGVLQKATRSQSFKKRVSRQVDSFVRELRGWITKEELKQMRKESQPVILRISASVSQIVREMAGR